MFRSKIAYQKIKHVELVDQDTQFRYEHHAKVAITADLGLEPVLIGECIPRTKLVFLLTYFDGSMEYVEVASGSKDAKKLLKLNKECEQYQQLREYMETYQNGELHKEELPKNCICGGEYHVPQDYSMDFYDMECIEGEGVLSLYRNEEYKKKGIRMRAFAMGKKQGQYQRLGPIELKQDMILTLDDSVVLRVQKSHTQDAIVEVCCGSYEDCMAANRGGAKRVELNSALSVGGLTPSLATLIQVKKDSDLKVICMVRPRAAGFCYQESEKNIMLEDARILLEHGADGIAFGFLQEDASIQEEYTKAMVDLIHSYGKEAVFHRAFDVVKDPDQAIQTLIKLKVDRILTSGQKAKAMDGIELIKELQANYGTQIELLAGSGMNESNAKTMLEYTKIKQIHSSCKAYVQDVTTQNEFVSYAYIQSTNNYDVVSEEKVRALIEAI